ncbi:MAG: polysaccharide deacetylase family sporulation protein PdaB [Peptococcaceae bacterium]|nr:polysaccharide deacetylase family sporulation protein PdaB [Peptococcaceae bacterium]
MKIIFLKKRKLILLGTFFLLLVIIISLNDKVTTVITKSLKPIYAVKTDTNQIAITFDISWGEENVIPILEILKAKDIKATFFLSSPWAEKKPELVKRIVEDGHEVGSHGRRHVDLNTLSESELINELNISKSVLEEITGKKINLLRPPNGAYDNKVISVANNLGYKVIQWSVDSLDWKKPGPNAVINNIVNGRQKNKGAAPGDILLFHASDSAPDTPKALPSIIEALNSKNYELVPVGTLLNNAKEYWPPESNF